MLHNKVARYALKMHVRNSLACRSSFIEAVLAKGEVSEHWATDLLRILDCWLAKLKPQTHGWLKKSNT